jgi:LysM repeat protein
MDEAAVDGLFSEFPDEPEEAIVHTVQAGETLSEIGLAYGVPWQTLAANNHITDPATLYEGERLSISLDPVRTSTDDLEEMIHTVRTGENLFRIGLKYGVNWEYIARENRILDGSVLFEGQVLKIPVARGGPEY